MLLSAAVVVNDVNFLNVQEVRNNAASDVTRLSDPATCAWFGTMQPICDVFI